MPQRVCCVSSCNSALAEGAVLHAFPNPRNESEKFKAWVKNAGLNGEDDNYVYKNRRICHHHFDKIFHYPKNRLSKLAIPKLNLSDVEFDPRNLTKSEDVDDKDKDKDPLIAEEKETKVENEFDDEIEYFDEFHDNSVKEEVAVTQRINERNLIAVDEIDSLFSSYAGAFRKFPIELQTMLKLDIAKLFARYETKHAVRCVLLDKMQNEERQIRNNRLPVTKVASKIPEKNQVPLISKASEACSFDTVTPKLEPESETNFETLTSLDSDWSVPEKSVNKKAMKTFSSSKIKKLALKRSASCKVSVSESAETTGYVNSKDQNYSASKVQKVKAKPQELAPVNESNSNIESMRIVEANSNAVLNTLQVEDKLDHEGLFTLVKVPESVAEQYDGDWKQVTDNDPLYCGIVLHSDPAKQTIKLEFHDDLVTS